MDHNALRNHVIRTTQQCRWHREAEQLGGLEVDYQIEVRRPLDWQVGRAGALENLGDIDGNPLHQLRGVRTVRQQGSVLRPLSPATGDNEPVLCGKFGDLLPLP